MSVGSCNKNNRGDRLRGRASTVAVLDPAWVRAGPPARFSRTCYRPAPPPRTTVATWWDQFQQAASWNDSVYANWDAEGFDISLDGAPLPTEYTPDGFVHSLDFGSLDDCLLESVGPDMVGTED